MENIGWTDRRVLTGVVAMAVVVVIRVLAMTTTRKIYTLLKKIVMASARFTTEIIQQVNTTTTTALILDVAVLWIARAAAVLLYDKKKKTERNSWNLPYRKSPKQNLGWFGTRQLGSISICRPTSLGGTRYIVVGRTLIVCCLLLVSSQVLCSFRPAF